jgi:hypothetical protein
MWIVEIADYMGDDYWYDYPPFEFDTEEAARAFAESQTQNPGSKIRRIYQKTA